MLGNSRGVPEHLIGELEDFVCSMYGGTLNESKVDNPRLIRSNELCAKEVRLTPSNNVDMASLRPCRTLT